MIILSAGHYPEAKGASFGGVNEYDLAVEWVETIRNYIHILNPRMRVTIVPTGHLRDKIKTINRIDGCCAMEVHFNSATYATGCETLHYPSRKGRELAEFIHEMYQPSMRNRNRGVKVGYYRMDRTRGFLAFLEQTNKPAIIIEPEFITNVHYINQYRDQTCLNLAYGLIKYAESQY